MSQNDITFWEERWQSVIDASAMRRRNQTGADGMRRWNKMAAGFAERTADPSSEEKRIQTVQWLKDLGALTPGARVLDIGAGPGNWSSLLAQTAAHVTALEPADAMADILQKKIDAVGIPNITIDRRTWQAVDLEKESMTGAFDLVFASMTPGIDGPANLKKMIAASRGHCYLSAFSGGGWRKWYRDLWQAVFNESLDGFSGDIIHPFNLVYAMGLRPELRFNTFSRRHDMSREKAIDEFLIHVEDHGEITDAIRRQVAAFVDSRLTDGRFIQERSACQGMMVWRVEGKLEGDSTEG